MIDTTAIAALQPGALYAHFAGQMRAQPAYLYIDAQGVVTADYTSGDGTPMDVWHGVCLRYSVPADVSVSDLHAYVADGRGRELLDQIHAGHSVEWDGGNRVGQLTSTALAAGQQLSQDLDQLDRQPVYSIREQIEAERDHLSAGAFLVELLRHGSAAAYAQAIRDGLVDGVGALLQGAAEELAAALTAEVERTLERLGAATDDALQAAELIGHQGLADAIRAELADQ